MEETTFSLPKLILGTICAEGPPSYTADQPLCDKLHLLYICILTKPCQYLPFPHGLLLQGSACYLHQPGTWIPSPLRVDQNRIILSCMHIKNRCFHAVFHFNALHGKVYSCFCFLLPQLPLHPLRNEDADPGSFCHKD